MKRDISQNVERMNHRQEGGATGGASNPEFVAVLNGTKEGVLKIK